MSNHFWGVAPQAVCDPLYCLYNQIYLIIDFTNNWVFRFSGSSAEAELADFKNNEFLQVKII